MSNLLPRSLVRYRSRRGIAVDIPDWAACLPASDRLTRVDSGRSPRRRAMTLLPPIADTDSRVMGFRPTPANGTVGRRDEDGTSHSAKAELTFETPGHLCQLPGIAVHHTQGGCEFWIGGGPQPTDIDAALLRKIAAQQLTGPATFRKVIEIFRDASASPFRTRQRREPPAGARSPRVRPT